MTDPLEVYQPPAPPTNVWPRIVEASATPPNWTPVVPTGELSCDWVKLSIGTFSDENEEDNLRIRLFVDGEVADQALRNKTGEIDRLGYDYTLKPEKLCRGYHVVKVLVADGPWAESGGFDQVEGVDRGTASYTWAVNTSTCSNGAGDCSR
ncbi:MAG: hypothetical protein QM765_05350 [Myxococcales bacterium]